jgi:hypothetical protein
MQYLALIDGDTLLTVAEVVGADRIADFVAGEPLFTSEQRVRVLDFDEPTGDYLPGAMEDFIGTMNEVAQASDDDIDDEHRAQAAQIELGEIIPLLQLAVREAHSDRVKESLVGMLDAALQAHRELGSYISRPGEFSHSRASDSLEEFIGLTHMAHALIDSVRPHVEGPEVGADKHQMAPGPMGHTSY